MEIIIPHQRADFDAFASMLLASKMFPEAVPILSNTLVVKLNEFLSLYRDVADFQRIKYLKKRKARVDHVIVVDTKKKGQLRDFENYMAGAELTIYDHHPPTSDDLHTENLELFPYGANTTGLLLKLLGRGLHFSPLEATVALLGIYADTGNLTYPATTAEDAQAVSELLRLGADLATVNQYLRPHFDLSQRYVFREMLSSAREYDMEGYNVVLVKLLLQRPLEGISVLVSQAGDMVGADAILGVFAAESRPGVQIIVQSHIPEIDAGEIATHFSGGGHAGAAAAFLPKADLEGVADTLMTLLTEAPLPTTKVGDLMSRDVLTVTPDTPLAASAELMRDKGVRGAPVVNDRGFVVGVISMRDVEKASIHGLLQAAPTSAFMSEKVTTLSPDTPLVAAKKVITTRNIGHLPITDDGLLVGIVSRTDILNNHARNGGAEE